MATAEQRRNVNHLIYDVTINEFQQMTDLHVQQVTELKLEKLMNDIKEKERERKRETFNQPVSVELDQIFGSGVRRYKRDNKY